MLQLLKNNSSKTFKNLFFQVTWNHARRKLPQNTLVGQSQSRHDATKPQGTQRAFPTVTSSKTSEMRQ